MFSGIRLGKAGKASFTEQQIKENVEAFLSAIVKAKPTGVKGKYLKGIAINSPMGPGVKIDTAGIG